MKYAAGEISSCKAGGYTGRAMVGAPQTTREKKFISTIPLKIPQEYVRQ
jgi:hypothetical protein